MNWTRKDYWLEWGHGADQTVEALFDKVFRQEFNQPGFVIIACPAEWDSHQFRRAMVDIKEALSARFLNRKHVL